MRNKIKVLSLAAFVALTMGVVATNLNSTNPKKAEASETSPVFAMIEGASVRMPTQKEQEQNIGSGIRFSSRFNEAYATQNFAEANNVTLYSKVESVSNSEQYFLQSWTLKGENAISLEYNAAGEAKFHHAITFDKLVNSEAENAEELMAQASALDLKGTMWLEIDGEQVLTDNAETVDNVRSARIVAYTAYQDNNELEGLDKYVTLDSTFVITGGSDDQAYFEENKTGESEALIKTFGLNARYQSLDLYDGLKKIGVNKELTAADFTDGLGSTLTLLGFDAKNNVYSVPAQYVTKAITTSSDLSVLDISTSNEYATYAYEDNGTTVSSCKVDGYFVLGNDIAYDETWEYNTHGTASASYAGRAFVGTFDGRGHTMTLDVGAGGVFGSLGKGSSVKNVGVIINEMKNTATGGAMGYCSSNGACYMNEVYLKVDLSETDATAYPITVNGKYLKMTNVVIEAKYAEDRTAGVLFYALSGATTSVTEQSSAFLITNNTTAPLVTYYATKTSDDGVKYVSSHYEVYAENEGATDASTVDITAEEDKNGLAHTKTIRVLSGLRRYTSLSVMSADKENFDVDEFNSYWVTVSGVPVWKTAADVKIEGTEEILFVGEAVTLKATCGDLDVQISSITSEDEDILAVDGATLTAKGVGETTYKVVYRLGNVSYSQEFSIVCKAQEITKSDVVEYFSASDGVFDLALLTNGEAASEVLKATQLIDGEEVELTVSVGTDGALIIAGVTPNIVGESTKYTSTLNEYNNGALTEYTTAKTITERTVNATQITIYTQKTTYIFTNVKAYTMVIDEASDWKEIQATGYYILKTDIAFASGDTYTASVDFAGTLDGNGKTVSGFGGKLFNLLKGVVKDVSLVGTIGSDGTFGSGTNGSFVSNVYLSVTLANSGYALANNIYASVWENVIIEITNDATQAAERTDLLATAISSFSNNYKGIVFKNVIVITIDNEQSDISIDDDAFVDYKKSAGTTKYKVYASNDDATNFAELSKTTDDETTEVVSDGYRRLVYTGITRYADKADAQTVGNWTIDSDGKVTWTEA